MKYLVGGLVVFADILPNSVVVRDVLVVDVAMRLRVVGEYLGRSIA